MRYLLPILALILSTALAACEKEGPAEKAGKKIDETVEQIGEKSSDMADKMDEAVDAAQAQIEEAAEDVEEATDKPDTP
jgi:t-SNARE complex subunit (syntaxin)